MTAAAPAPGAPAPDSPSSLRALTPAQRDAFLAAFLGWTLDAFDFFLLVFVLDDVAKTFQATHQQVAAALTLTLAFRPLGAFLFGVAADRCGRRVPLMVDVILFSVLELLSGLAPSLWVFLLLRALFGVAMGGEWGLGASLALETAPAGLRGILSGILQEGYSVGYLLAALVYPLVGGNPALGWRWMFFVGALPALLSLFIRARVKESPVWEATRASAAAAAAAGAAAAHSETNGTRTRPDAAAAPGTPGSPVRRHAGLFVYLVVLMTAFTFMSHGTQDLYPTFLKTQRHFSPGTVSAIAVTYNVGALLGGVFFGWLSQRAGRRRSIVIAALLALPVIPLWAFSHSAALLALGAFLMQFFVQGAWGIIPAHLTELSPNALRGTFTGFAYQLGNLLSSTNANLQTGLATRWGGPGAPDYARALARTITVVLVAVAVVTAFGHEARGVEFAEPAPEPAPEQ